MGVKLGLSERRLRVFENRVLRTSFRPKGEELTGERTKWHNEKLRGLYFSPNVIVKTKQEKDERDT